MRADAWRGVWEECLPCLPDGARAEMRDLHVHVNGDLALAHWLGHLAGFAEDHPAARMWFRATVGCRREQGRWQIVHEHCSVPFDPMTSQAVFAV